MPAILIMGANELEFISWKLPSHRKSVDRSSKDCIEYSREQFWGEFGDFRASQMFPE